MVLRCPESEPSLGKQTIAKHRFDKGPRSRIDAGPPNTGRTKNVEGSWVEDLRGPKT